MEDNSFGMELGIADHTMNTSFDNMLPKRSAHIATNVLTKVALSNVRALRQAIHAIFDEAIDEAPWTSTCAELCKVISESISPDMRDESVLNKNGVVLSGRELVRKHLLDRCQEQFERRWMQYSAHRLRDRQVKNDKGESNMLSAAYYAAVIEKQRDLGLVKFLGELYMVNMFTDGIIHVCVRQLLRYIETPDESGIEPLTLLLKTVGTRLDGNQNGRRKMDYYFVRMQKVIDDSGYPSSMKSMLIDLVKLRRKGWQSQ